MNQIDSFRHVLGLPEPGEEKKNDNAMGGPVSTKTGKGLTKVKKKTPEGRAYGKAVSIKPDTHTRLKALLFWAGKEDLIEGRTMDALLVALIDAFVQKYPKAGAFIDKNVG